MKPMSARASLAHVHVPCVGSIALVNGGIPGVASGEAAALGTAFHDGIARFITEGASPDLGEDQWMFHLGRRIWTAVKGYFHEPSVEKEMVKQAVNGDKVTGHADVLSHTEKRNVVLDWKSGRVERDVAPQLKTYLGLMEPAEENYGIVGYVRTGEFEVGKFSPEEIEAHNETLFANLERAQNATIKDFNTGLHCEWCPAAMHCPAMKTQVADFTAAISGADAEALALATAEDGSPARIADVRMKLKLIDRFKDTFTQALRARIQAQGAIDLGATTLSLGKSERKEFEPIGTMALLKELGKNREQMAGILSVGNEALQKLVKDGAPARGKKAQWEKFVADASEKGVVSTTEITRLTEKKNNETIKEIEDGE